MDKKEQPRILNNLHGLYGKLLSFRAKVLYIPLLTVFFAVIIITSLSSHIIETSLHETMKNNGVYIAEQFAQRLESNEASAEILNSMIEKQIRAACNTVIQNQYLLNDYYLKVLASDLEVDEIYWFNSEGKVIYSTVPGYLGWEPDKEHPLNAIINGKQELMEDIRKDVKFGNYVKYGAVRNKDGTFVQVGISADKIKTLTDRFSNQTMVEDMASNNGIVYVSVMNKDGVITASNTAEKIGQKKDLTNTYSVNLLPYASEYYSDLLDENIYDVVYPIVINNEHRGTINIGYSMKGVHSAINYNIKQVTIVAVLVFSVLFLMMKRLSNGVIKIIENIKEHLGIMASGNFTHEISDNFINRKDEFGEIAKSLSTAQKAIENIIVKMEEAEKSLSESERNHRLMVEKMQLGLAVHEIITDETGKPVDYRFLSANKKFEKLTGLKRSEIIGKRVLEVMPNTEPYWINAYGEVALTGYSKEFENYSDELGKWYQVVAYSPAENQFAVIVDDISNRKKMEAMLYLEKENFKTTLLSIGDGVISTDNEGRVLLMNDVAEKLTGWKEAEAFGKNFTDVFSIVHEYTLEPCRNLVEDVILTGETKELANHTALIRRDNTMLPIEDSAAPIRNQHGEITGVVIVFRDFTEKREKQNQIEHLSYHDYLTGLYNRRYMEGTLNRIDTPENLPIALMVLDINGLKLTNDAFGHEMGDKLLMKVADTLKKVCRPKDIIARMGGDEFCILLTNTSHEQVLSIRDSIIDETARIELESVIVSVAVGYELKTEKSQNIGEIIKNAENFMYESKMKYGRAMRSQVIENVLRSINLRYDNEQIHTERVAQYCELMGKAMNFSDREIYSIKHAGILHDIGKIVVPPELLNKTERLTWDEFEIIKKHPETGYHILRNTYEYAGLAKIVRHHHERFDGNGYPDRLKGSEIPLESRIIAIADSYEAMTANRPYQKTKSKEEALSEIKRCSGTQFDPEIAEIFLKLMDGNQNQMH